MKEVGLEAAVEALRRGNILIYPTETVYGLGVDIQNSQALESLYSLKGRDPNKPVSVLLPSLMQLPQVVATVPALAQKIMEKFLPGPLTLVLPAHPDLDPRIHGGSGWVGVRMSSHPLAQALMKRFGKSITTTSANPSGEVSGQDKLQIQEYFGDSSELYFLDGGALPVSQGSTVIKIEGENLQLLRQGDIAFSDIQKLENDG